MLLERETRRPAGTCVWDHGSVYSGDPGRIMLVAIGSPLSDRYKEGPALVGEGRMLKKDMRPVHDNTRVFWQGAESRAEHWIAQEKVPGKIS